MTKQLLIALLALQAAVHAADYPVAFLAHPLKPTDNGGRFLTQSVSENAGNYVSHTGTDLIIANPDGTERVLVVGSQPSLGLLAVHDFCVSLDAQSIIYSHVRTIPGLPYPYYRWCDLYRVNVMTGERVQITDAPNEWNPPRGAAQWSEGIPARPDLEKTAHGRHFQTVWNMAPCELGDGSIMFCSNRQSMRAPAEGLGPAFQLFRMDADGTHVRLIDHNLRCRTNCLTCRNNCDC